jgi:hypothetical protein
MIQWPSIILYKLQVSYTHIYAHSIHLRHSSGLNSARFCHVVSRCWPIYPWWSQKYSMTPRHLIAFFSSDHLRTGNYIFKIFITAPKIIEAIKGLHWFITFVAQTDKSWKQKRHKANFFLHFCQVTDRTRNKAFFWVRYSIK